LLFIIRALPLNGLVILYICRYRLCN